MKFLISLILILLGVGRAFAGEDEYVRINPDISYELTYMNPNGKEIWIRFMFSFKEIPDKKAQKIRLTLCDDVTKDCSIVKINIGKMKNDSPHLISRFIPSKGIHGCELEYRDYEFQKNVNYLVDAYVKVPIGVTPKEFYKMYEANAGTLRELVKFEFWDTDLKQFGPIGFDAWVKKGKATNEQR